IINPLLSTRSFTACLAPKLKDYQSSFIYAQLHCLSCAKNKRLSIFFYLRAVSLLVLRQN
ncbi:hypothetical protein, partial [Acinetobacter seifertii]|uniref:hypothetical protein n=1 Tax=Acinetobacter seifertii TaxID=1530123 RepID=UPI0032B4A8C1